MVTKVKGTSEYTVNTVEITCTCPHFKYRCSHLAKDNPRRICKHLAKFIKPEKKRFTREYADTILAELSPILSQHETIVCGSYRRQKSTVGDIDVLLVTDDITPISEWVAKRFEVLWSGPEKISFIVDQIQVDFRRTDSEAMVTMAMYFTGSKEENIKLRSRARKLSLRLNEYGLWDGEEKLNCPTEESVYDTLGITYNPPQKR